ncbi:hypothetical protein TWF481_008334 [Arthrobotrys musiformis]|uniref:Major facilitator superfamily (MFS) profile domain-containing protein n=1 Tax=Arthrobotrys musiformis TaxID=47236 RepID=A0AAV9W7T2_9PEZI
MAGFQRNYVSNLVPSNPTVLNILLVAVAVVNSATLGYDASVMNGLSILPSYTEYFHLTDATTGLNNAAVWMGTILGIPLVQPIPDRYGRKNSILIATIITILGIVLQAAAQNIAMFVVGRVIIGLGTGLSNVSAAPLLAELLPPRSRSYVLGIFFSCFYVGGLLSAIINYGSQDIQSTWAWRLPSLLQFIPSVIAVCLLPFIPESPRWLIANGREEHATEVLAVLKGGVSDDSLVNAAAEMNDIKSTIAREEAAYPRNPWRELFSGPANRKRMTILILFGVMTEVVGNFIVSYYLTRILSQAGVTDTYRQTQINVIIQCWSFAVAVAGSFLLDIIGRRLQTLIGMVGMTVTLYLLGAFIKVYGDSTETAKNYGILALIFIFQGSYAFSITPMTSLYPTEICQYKLRAAGSAVFRLVDASLGLVMSFTMSFAMSDLGWKFYLINASWNVILTALVFFYFVETKGLQLEEIALKFGDNFIVGGTGYESPAAKGPGEKLEKGQLE